MIVSEIFSYLAVVISSVTAGYVYASICQMQQLKKDLDARVEDFTRIGKLAEAANNSLAAKLQDMDTKIDNLQQWRSLHQSYNATNKGR